MGVTAPRDAAGRGEPAESARPSTLVRVAVDVSPPGVPPELRRRVHDLVREHMDFVWRSLLRLGVNPADCDDGCQRVWLVVATKIDLINPDKAKSFIFSVVVRVASDMRRSQRNQPVEFDESSPPPGTSSGVIDAETLLERQRGWRLLDQLLSSMSWELRSVFVMYEIEGMSSLEIADCLGLRRGTVASRLRLAREAFRRGVQRYQAQPQAKPRAAGGRRRPWWFA